MLIARLDTLASLMGKGRGRRKHEVAAQVTSGSAAAGLDSRLVFGLDEVGPATVTSSNVVASEVRLQVGVRRQVVVAGVEVGRGGRHAVHRVHDLLLGRDLHVVSSS